MHREQLIELLWPRREEKAARNNLYNALHVIRDALVTADPHLDPLDYLGLSPTQVLLCPRAPLWIDVHAFQTAARVARAQREPAAYEAALALYTGDLLPEDRNEDWAIGTREALRSLRDALLLDLATLYESMEEYTQAIGALEHIVADDAANEQAQRRLMRLHALVGHRFQALRHYQLLRDALKEDLDAEPDASTRKLYEDILAERFPAGQPSGSVVAPEIATLEPSNRLQTVTPGDNTPAPALPSRTHHGVVVDTRILIGRERELADLRDGLNRTRLLTLVGAGGSGKSMLARWITANLQDIYPDGVIFVELAPVTTASMALHAVLRAAGMPGSVARSSLHTLVRVFAKQEVLLVLDHADHLLPVCRRLAAALLAHTPVHILVTSGKPLNAGLELVWPVPPLSMPAYDLLTDPGTLRRYDAVRLFVAHRRSRFPDFSLDAPAAGVVARLCRQLAGNPLALRIAAAQPGERALALLADALDTVVRSPADPDMPVDQALTAVLQCCEHLLSPEERILFRRLAIFTDGWWDDAPFAVCADEHLAATAIPDALARLAQRSLVEIDQKGRHALAEGVRQFARTRLETDDDVRALQRRHTAHYWSSAVRVRELPDGPDRRQIVDWLLRDRANLQDSMARALADSDPERALQFGASLWHLYSTGSLVREGRAWLQAILIVAETTPESYRALFTQVLHGAGVLASLDGDMVRAAALHAQELTLSRARGDLHAMSGALISLARVAHAMGDVRQSFSYLTEALAAIEPLEDRRAMARVLDVWADLHAYGGSYRQAMQLRMRIHGLYVSLGDVRATARTLMQIGAIALSLGERDRAAQLLSEAQEWSGRLADSALAGETLLCLAQLALRQADPARAELLLQDALAHSQMPRDPARLFDAQLALTRLALFQGDLDRAATWCRESAATARELDTRDSFGLVLLSRAEIARARGAYAVACAGYQESLAYLALSQQRAYLAQALVGLASAAMLLGDHATAARLLGLDASLRAADGAPLEPALYAERRRLLREARRVLHTSFTLRYQAGRIVAPRDVPAVAASLQIQQGTTVVGAGAAGRPKALSRRESEVARHIASGRTNREVAAALGVDVRTVETFVRRLFKKLGITTRHELRARIQIALPPPHAIEDYAHNPVLAVGDRPRSP
jgi:predicted ATPase/DNA-binding SARP family transcriptional activator/DNA-binding CsgD family transcriptional regulator